MIEYYISSTKYSLQERMTRRGKVYDVVFRIVTLDGTEKQKKLSGYTNKTLAKQAYTDFVTSKCELVKNNPLKKKNPQKEDLIVGDLIKQYLLSLSNQNKDSSIYDKKKIYDVYILPDFKDAKIKEITTATLYTWQDKLWATKNPKTGEYFSHNYLSKIRGHFAAFFGWYAERYDAPNPFSKLKKPKRRIPKQEMLIWERWEFEKFIQVVDDPLYHTLFMMMFFTGHRKGEIFALSPDDVHKTSISFNKSLTIRTLDSSLYKITSTKAEKTQETPICPTLQQELNNYTPPQGNFFFGGDRPLPQETVRRKFNQYIKKAEVKQIRIHDLRHSFVSMVIHMGASIPVVADLIGDTQEQITKTYSHLYQSDKTSIISRL